MKIEINLTKAQISFLTILFNSFVDDNKKKFVSATRKEKAVYTIAMDVADKLYTKSRAIERQVKTKKNINKPAKMTFKYHEAHAINYMVEKLKDNYDDSYFRSLAQNIYNELDPKLS